MPHPGVFFIDLQPSAGAITSRADVTMSVGLVKRRDGKLPSEGKNALVRAGWTVPLRSESDTESLLDVPVPIDSFEQFDRLFADERLIAATEAALVPTTLVLAVRSFFTEGGRKCYVIRCGDPVPLIANAGN